MMKWVPCPWRTATVLALVLALGMGTASAKKPVKPPPPDPDPPPSVTGTLVCGSADGFFTMGPDGADPTSLTLPSPCTTSGSASRISRERHNGLLWRIQSCVVGGATAVDGDTHEELFVIAEGDSIGLQLTDDPNMVFSYYNECLEWGPEDGFVSWVAHTVEEGEIVEAGVFAASLLYDTDGDIVGLADDPELVVSVSTQTLLNGSVVTMVRNGHDWSPDGTQVVWHHFDGTLYVTDVAYPTAHTLLTTTSTALTGQWSSQDQIVFSTGLLIKRIDADGTDETTIVTAKRRTNVLVPKWSPDGEWIGYHVRDSKGNLNIYVTPVDSPQPASTGEAGGVKRWLDE